MPLRDVTVPVRLRATAGQLAESPLRQLLVEAADVLERQAEELIAQSRTIQEQRNALRFYTNEGRRQAG